MIQWPSILTHLRHRGTWERFEPLDKIDMEKMEKEKHSADRHNSNAIVKF